jgi:hypothetical protein
MYGIGELYSDQDVAGSHLPISQYIATKRPSKALRSCGVVLRIDGRSANPYINPRLDSLPRKVPDFPVSRQYSDGSYEQFIWRPSGEMPLDQVRS